MCVCVLSATIHTEESMIYHVSAIHTFKTHHIPRTRLPSQHNTTHGIHQHNSCLLHHNTCHQPHTRSSQHHNKPYCNTHNHTHTHTNTHTHTRRNTYQQSSQHTFSQHTHTHTSTIITTHIITTHVITTTNIHRMSQHSFRPLQIPTEQASCTQGTSSPSHSPLWEPRR